MLIFLTTREILAAIPITPTQPKHAFLFWQVTKFENECISDCTVPWLECEVGHTFLTQSGGRCAESNINFKCKFRVPVHPPVFINCTQARKTVDSELTWKPNDLILPTVPIVGWPAGLGQPAGPGSKLVKQNSSFHSKIWTQDLPNTFDHLCL